MVLNFNDVKEALLTFESTNQRSPRFLIVHYDDYELLEKQYTADQTLPRVYQIIRTTDIKKYTFELW